MGDNSRNLQMELFPEETAELSEPVECAVPEGKKPERKPNGTTVIDETWYTKTLNHVVNYRNMLIAFKKVASKGGAGGVDGMQSGELMHWFHCNYDRLRDELLEGSYKPSPVRRVEIPKENGKTRSLGIPTLTDRGIQMAMVQVLTPIYEPEFSEASYGFRPKRSAHDALRKCLEYANEGYEWVVDMDLEKYFDTVPQDRLLQLISEKIKDGRIISLLRKFLRSGVDVLGLFEETDVGVPQGSCISPILGNIMLDVCDKELEKRGLRFVRYADDMMIFVRSERSAYRVMESVTNFIEKKLHLKVNREKTVVRRITNDIKFLGHGFWKMNGKVRLTIHKRSMQKMEEKLKEILKRRNSNSYEVIKKELKSLITGWMNYFRFADAKKKIQKMDEWMRHKIRCLIFKRLWRPRSRYKYFISLGVKHRDALNVANARQGFWAFSGFHAVSKWGSNDVLRKEGYTLLTDTYMKLHVSFL